MKVCKWSIPWTDANIARCNGREIEVNLEGSRNIIIEFLLLMFLVEEQQQKQQQ